MQQGRAAEAVAVYRQIIVQDPANADAWNRLGVVLFQAGRAGEAIGFIQRAIDLNPRMAPYRSALAAALAGHGRQPEAIAQYREALTLQPDSVEAWEGLGTLLRENGDAKEALAAYRKAAEWRPGDAGILHRLGSLLVENHQYREAITPLERALSLQPGFYPALNNLGLALQRSGNLDGAIAAFERAIVLQPDLSDLHHNLGSALVEAGRWDAAITELSHDIRFRPQNADGHFRLADALQGAGRFNDAIAAYQRAIQLRPNFAEAWHNLGNAFKDSGQVDEAIKCYRHSMELGLNSFEVHGNLGTALRTTGQLDAAIASLRRAAEMRPCSGAAQNLLFTIHLHPDYDAKRIYDEHARWNQACARPLSGLIQPHQNDRSPARRLRVGYVSPDFRKHPVGALFLPVISNHNRTELEVYCYSNVLKTDSMTARICPHADVWREIAHMSDDALAALIREDRIDILVDLALHTETSRLLMFARKPAPVLVTWLGYPSTTGLEVMDYRLSDPYLDPPSMDRAGFYSETTVLLESFWCYDPLIDIPIAPQTPAEQNGFITFGCLNNAAKITDATLSLWSQVMRSVDRSQLIALVPEVARTYVASGMLRNGIDASRLHFVDRLARERYLETYNQIDISLDTYPYCGHTTTLDALWMGSPVVTLSGQTAVSRGATSILSNAGCNELIAQSVPQYVRIVTHLTQDLPALTQLKFTLRERMKASVLMDPKRYAQNLERAYRTMWEKWCKQ